MTAATEDTVGVFAPAPSGWWIVIPAGHETARGQEHANLLTDPRDVGPLEVTIVETAAIPVAGWLTRGGATVPLVPATEGGPRLTEMQDGAARMLYAPQATRRSLKATALRDYGDEWAETIRQTYATDMEA